MTSLNFSERYAAFLLTYLPRLKTASIFSDNEKVNFRGSVLITALSLASETGLNLEFGVFKGDSIRLSASRFPKRHFHGFDSFEGFPTDGRSDWNNNFKVDNIPSVPDNVSLFKGWFDETLPKFLKENPEPISVLNIDCDIYSSTRTVFDLLVNDGRIKEDIVINFDELINYNGFIENEMLALFQMLEKTGLGLDWIACHKHVRLVEESLLQPATDWNDDLKKGYYQQAALVLTKKGIDLSCAQNPHILRKIKILAPLIEERISKTLLREILS